LPDQAWVRRCSSCRDKKSLAAGKAARKIAKAKYGPRASYRARARKYGVEYTPLNRLLVFQRDGYRCGICGKKVNKRLKYPHPMSVSLDHVVPMALGGGHTYANVQCAHLICNGRKSHLGAGDQLALL
jgi:5-methylcytosine-specific restriction endonuclease McrA